MSVFENVDHLTDECVTPAEPYAKVRAERDTLRAENRRLDTLVWHLAEAVARVRELCPPEGADILRARDVLTALDGGTK